MARDESTGSLADQAAAWVPPWSRQPGAGEDEAPTDAPPGEVADAGEAADAGEVVHTGEAADLDDEDTSDTLDIAAHLTAPEQVRPDEAGPPAEVAAAEPAVDLLGPDEPLPPMEPGEPLEPAEPLEPVEPLPPDEPLGPLLPDEPIMTADQPDAEPQLVVMSDAELKGAIEAILLVVDEPVGEIMLAQIIEQPTERIIATLAVLAAGYDEQERGFELRAVAGGWRFYTRTAFAPYVERFVLDGQQVRLTQAALETLAVIAYKQPVTRSRISAIRGVNCDGVTRTLLSRGLIEEAGSEPDSGAYLYRTTTLFLEKLGLNSVDQLPPLAPFLPDDVEALADATG